MTVFALIEETTDVSGYPAVMQLFASRADAERVKVELIGKQRFTDSPGVLWGDFDFDLSIKEMDVR